MIRNLRSTLTLICALCAATATRADVITFEGIPGIHSGDAIPNGYGGLNWNNLTYQTTTVPPSGLSHAASSGTGFAYYGGGFNLGGSIQITTPGSTFSLNSAYFTAAGRSLTITATAFDGLVPVQFDTFTVGNTATLETFTDFTNITGVLFTPDTILGNRKYGVDDLNITFPSSGTGSAAAVTPEPGSLVLACLAAVGAGVYGWRRRRAA